LSAAVALQSAEAGFFFDFSDDKSVGLGVYLLLLVFYTL
jgi:hypothetical protein